MADLATLEGIRNPTGGKLTQLGSIISKRSEQNRQAKMEQQIFNLKKQSMELEAKEAETAFMGDIALSMKAYYDQGGSPEGAKELYETFRDDAVNLGYKMPENVPNPAQIEGLAARSKQYIGYLNATKSANSAKKWQFIASIAAVPESKRTPEQQRMLEELTRPDTVIKVPGPTGRIRQVANNFLNSAKVGDKKIKGQIEGEDGYLSDVMSRAQAIQADAKKAMSFTDALDQAHNELQYKLIPTETFKVGGFSPFGKEYIYNPDAVPGQVTDSDMEEGPSSLKEGESGIFEGFEYKRENGKLMKRKVE